MSSVTIEVSAELLAKFRETQASKQSLVAAPPDIPEAAPVSPSSELQNSVMSVATADADYALVEDDMEPPQNAAPVAAMNDKPPEAVAQLEADPADPPVNPHIEKFKRVKTEQTNLIAGALYDMVMHRLDNYTLKDLHGTKLHFGLYVRENQMPVLGDSVAVLFKRMEPHGFTCLHLSCVSKSRDMVYLSKNTVKSGISYAIMCNNLERNLEKVENCEHLTNVNVCICFESMLITVSGKACD